jgi:hypothetical protein
MSCLPDGRTWVPSTMDAPITKPGFPTSSQPPDPVNTIKAQASKSIRALRNRGATSAVDLARRDVPRALRHTAVNLKPLIPTATAALEGTVGYSMHVRPCATASYCCIAVHSILLHCIGQQHGQSWQSHSSWHSCIVAHARRGAWGHAGDTALGQRAAHRPPARHKAALDAHEHTPPLPCAASHLASLVQPSDERLDGDDRLALRSKPGSKLDTACKSCTHWHRQQYDATCAKLCKGHACAFSICSLERSRSNAQASQWHQVHTRFGKGTATRTGAAHHQTSP